MRAGVRATVTRTGSGLRGGLLSNLAAVLGLALALGFASACSRSEDASGAKDAAPVPSAAPAQVGPRDVAVLDVKGFGTVRFELLGDKAPGHVANFEKLAESGFYDGTTFHRVIPGFMIQGGDPNSRNRDPRDDGMGGPGYQIPEEFNDTRHVRGVVSMARGGGVNTAGSQFFIVVQDQPHLDGQYTAFGRVVSGMDVVDRIVATPRDEFGRHGPPDRPIEDVLIESVRIERPGAGAGSPPASAPAAPSAAPGPAIGGAPPAAPAPAPTEPSPGATDRAARDAFHE
jgi:cyclophilin family peptidyl-prolyl cis-trans isomerase